MYSTSPRLGNGRCTASLRLRNSRLRNSRDLETDKLAYIHTINSALNLHNIETSGSLTVVWEHRVAPSVFCGAYKLPSGLTQVTRQ